MGSLKINYNIILGGGTWMCLEEETREVGVLYQASKVLVILMFRYFRELLLFFHLTVWCFFGFYRNTLKLLNLKF